MITQNDTKNIEYGLSVTYDGKSYTLLCDSNVRDYPVGGLISEYCRLVPTTIKEVIMDCPGLEMEATPDNVAFTVTAFHDRLAQIYEPVIAIMVSLEFMTASIEWFDSRRQGNEDEFVALFKEHCSSQITDFIFEGTPFQEVGSTSILQMMLSIYLGFASTYSTTKYLFGQIIGAYDFEEEKREEAIKLFSELYSTYMEVQHIDFRIINTEKGFESFYTIKTSMSLLLFEMANSIKANTNFVKCFNCNQIFVPEGRSDTLYCSYPSPQNKDKTCREIGAQITRANKEKNDVVTREYRKVYMRYTMMAKRHPGDSDVRNTLDQLTSGMREWRNKLSQGTATSEECLDWISRFRQ